MKIVRSFKFRIYPNRQQSERLEQWSGALRFLWNLAHEQRLLGLSRPLGEQRFVSWKDQSRETTLLRDELPWLKDVPCQACTATTRRLSEAWRRCFSRVGGRPSFKRKGRDGVSIELDARNVSLLDDSNRIVLSKLGSVIASRHRALSGRTVRVTIVREVDQWFAVLAQEIVLAAAQQREGSVGLDRGIAYIVADSDGHTIDNPRFTQRVARKVRRLSRALARSKKGSKNRKKARLGLARAHRTVKRQRAWLQHQISHDYANSHGTVVIEKLATARLTRSASGTVEAPGRNVSAKAVLNRGILDAGWYGLARMLKYKLEERGGQLAGVPSAYSSQTCSACGVVDAASRRTQAEFCCVACGHSANADINAARVILSRWSPPVQPVEALPSGGQ